MYYNSRQNKVTVSSLNSQISSTSKLCFQLDNSKHRSRVISRLSEDRKIHASSCNIDYPDRLSPCLRTVTVTKNSNPGGFSVEKVGRNNCDKDWKNANLLFKRRSSLSCRWILKSPYLARRAVCKVFARYFSIELEGAIYW